MRRATILGGAAIAVAVVAVLIAVGLVLRSPDAGRRAAERQAAPGPPPPTSGPAAPPPAEAYQGFLYGRITTDDGATYQGRLRWGGGEEAFWGDYFNGFKPENSWAGHVAPERLTERRPVSIFGVEIAQRERQIDLGRPFMARFGDIARIEPHGKDLQVALKNGTVFHLDRFAADDLADGVRVWDERSGVVDLDEWQIRTLELLPTARLATVPARLHGTVRSRQGDFTGFVQWNREKCVGSDELVGKSADGERSLRFDTIRSIARESRDAARVTLVDGREIVLADAHKAGQASRGIYVDDRRYGRVLVSWDAFERLDFSPGGSGPAYDDFPPGRPLTGTVTTRTGRRLSGRLVYDLDESQTTETLDAASEGVDYTIPFGLIAAIDRAAGPGGEHAEVTLHGGEDLRLEAIGDLGDGNAGMLVFVDSRERPEYLPWQDVERIELDRPPAMYPPLP